MRHEEGTDRRRRRRGDSQKETDTTGWTGGGRQKEADKGGRVRKTRKGGRTWRWGGGQDASKSQECDRRRRT